MDGPDLTLDLVASEPHADSQSLNALIILFVVHESQFDLEVREVLGD